MKRGVSPAIPPHNQHHHTHQQPNRHTPTDTPNQHPGTVHPANGIKTPLHNNNKPQQNK